MRQLLKSGIRRIAQQSEKPRTTRPRGDRAATVIAVAAQKGGVGKTTTSINLASALSRHHGKRVLLVDLDPQGHVNSAIGGQVHVGGGALSDVFQGQGEVIDIITTTAVSGMDVTPLDSQLATTENLLGTRIGKEFVLREALEITRTWYDVIVLDCPPNLGNLTINALVAADQVLIPCDPSPLALTGVHSLIEAMQQVAVRLNPDLEVLGVLLTRVDGRNTTLNEAIVNEVEQAYGDAVLPVRIGINNSLAKAQNEGKDIFAYDAGSRGAQHYLELAAHLVAQLD